MELFLTLDGWMLLFLGLLVGSVICVYIFRQREMAKDSEVEKQIIELKKWAQEQTLDLKAANRKLTEALDQHALSEDALRKSEASNQALLRALPDRIFRIHRDGHFLDFRMNMTYQPVSALVDVGARTLDDMKSDNFVVPMKKYMALALESGEMQSFEYEEVDDQGVRFQEVRVVQESDDAVVAIARDISERKHMEKHIIQLERQQALGELSHGVSHNVNNILTGILGPAQLIRKKSQDDEVAHTADMIIHSAKRATELVKRLSQAVQTRENGKLYPVVLQDVVGDVVEQIERLCEQQSKNCGGLISIETEITTDLPIKGTWDGMVIILEHLLTNAVEALPQGGKISLRIIRVGSYIELLVKDDGVGMDEETTSRVFEPFFTTKKEVGPGLGLTTVHGLVTGWKGEISVESLPKQGACFRVLLPISDQVKVPKRKSKDVLVTRRLRILVVDDDPIVCYTLVEFLKHDHDVKIVNTGQGALDTFCEGQYDVILLDLPMSDMPGNVISKRLKTLDTSLCTVLITGAPLEADDPILNDFDFYLKKPFANLDQFGELLSEICGQQVVGNTCERIC